MLLALTVALVAIHVPTLAQDEAGTIPSFRLASPSAGELVITWERPASPSVYPTDYRVAWARVGQKFPSHRSANEADRGNTYADGDTTELTLPGLPKGVDYKAQIRSRYHDGEFAGNQRWSGPWSGAKTQRVRDDPPLAPTDLTAHEVSHGSVTLRWTAPGYDGLTGYRILRGANADSVAAIVNDMGDTGTEYTDDSVSAGTTYVYVVVALSPDGDSTHSNAVEVTSHPPAPTGLEANPQDDQVSLTWEAPEDASVTGYRILRGPSADELEVLAEGEATRYADSAVEPSTVYHYAVRAFNDGGTGPQSATVSVETPVKSARQRGAGAQDDSSAVSIRQAMGQASEIVAVSNLGKDTNSARDLDGGTAVVLSFSTGDKRYVLNKIRADLNSIGGRIEVLLHADDSGSPGERLLSLGGPDSPSGEPGHAGDFEGLFGAGYDDFSSEEYILASGATYWVVFQETVGGGVNTARAIYRYASSHDEDSGGLDGWSIGNMTYTRDSRSSDFVEGSTNELPVMAIFVKNLVAVTGASVTSTPLDGDTYKAGENLEVQITFDGPVTHVSGGLSLEVGSDTRTATFAGGNETKQLLFHHRVQSDDIDTGGFKIKANGLRDATITATDSVVSKDFTEVDTGSSHKVDGGTVGCERAWCADMEVNEVVSGSVSGFLDYGPDTRIRGSLSNRVVDLDGSTHVVDQLLVRNGNRLETGFDRPPEQHLLDNARLLTGTVYYYLADGSVSGNRVIWQDLDLTWTAGSTIRVFLERNLLVGNLTGAGTVSPVVSAAMPKAAQPFTTGAHPGGYSLDRILLYFSVTASDVVPKVSIYEDDGETLLHTLSNPGTNPLSAEVLGFAAQEAFLKPNTTYWLVLEHMSAMGALSTGTEDSDDEFVPSLGDWSIGNSFRTNDGASWSEATLSGTTPSIQIEVRGRPVSHNFPVQGQPGVSGVLEPGLMAYADTTSLFDGNGADPAAYGYEWVLVDGHAMTVLADETSSHYTIQPGDVGKRLVARVSFVDDAGFAETAASDPSPEVSAASAYLVSNLSETKSGTVETQSTVPRLANSFTTGASRVVLEGVHLLLAANPGADLSLSIYSHNSSDSLPDSSLHVFTNPSAVDDSPDSAEKFTIGSTILSANTTYWLVVERRSGEEDAILAYTTSGAEVSDFGCVIGPQAYTETNGDWFPGTNGILMFALLGRAANAAPSFPNAAETLTVDENTTSGSVGTVAADQADSDPLTYSLSGPGVAVFNDNFAINTATGEITVKTGATIDFEARPSYAVTLRVTDDSDEYGNTDSAVDDMVGVTLNVNNVEEAGAVRLEPSTPEMNMPVTATLTDPDGGVTAETWQWQSAATAAGPFSNITGATTAIFTPRQADFGRLLKARVNYTDGQGSGKTAAAISPAVVLPEPNQSPGFGMSSTTLPVNENAAAGRLGAVQATDPEEDTLTYKVSGPDEAAFNEDFALDDLTGEVTVKPGATIDFESRAMYEVTVGVHDGKDIWHNPSDAPDATLTLTLKVNNLDEPGSIALSPRQPAVGTVTRATVEDQDGGVAGVSFRWYRAITRGGHYAAIPGASGPLYNPVETDAGKYLEVRASYSDRFGPGKSAEIRIRNPVQSSTGGDVANPDLSVGPLAAYWMAGGGAGAPGHPDATNGNTLRGECSGDRHFMIYWHGPEESRRADLWETYITRWMGVESYGYNFREKPSGSGLFRMYGKVTFDGAGSVTLRVRARFGSDWGTWSPASSLFCVEE